jgi:hypothetical protein
VRFSRPGIANRRMAIPKSVLSDCKGLRRHLRVVVLPIPLAPQGAAMTLAYAPSGRSRSAHFALRNEMFRRAWRNSLKSLRARNRAFRGIDWFQWLNSRFASPVSQVVCFQWLSTPFRFAAVFFCRWAPRPATGGLCEARTGPFITSGKQ